MTLTPPSIGKMPFNRGDSNRLRQLITLRNEYLIAVVLCVLILCVSLKIWRWDMNVPFSYWGDAILVEVWNKTIYEFGWYVQNPRLGAPFGMHLGDYPIAEGLHQCIYKILGLMTPNYVVAMNLFFLATFPLTTLTSLYVLRKFGLGALIAVTGSLLYTFMPYHLSRHIHHFYLASYYVVPLSIMVVLWIYSDSVRGFLGKSAPQLEAGPANRPRLLGSLAICVLQGCAGVYYAFFACYLLLISGGMAAIQRRRLYPFYTAMSCIAVTCITLLVNLSPHIVYQLEHGKNPEIAVRGTIEAEVHGLKIAQLMLPAPEHRLKPLAKLNSRYSKNSVSTAENHTSTLGLVGAVGFLILLLQLCMTDNKANQILMGLSKLNIFAVLLATMGGFSSLFSLLISPMIRGYNRMSVFIGFFCLFAICLMLDRLAKWLSQRGYSQWWFRSLVCTILIAGILDQIPANEAYRYTGDPHTVARWKNDADFFARVEESMPEHAMIFQYPHLTFPEGAWVPGLESLDESGGFHHMSYDHARGYLHTKTLRWSFPIRGRHLDKILIELSKKPLPEQLKAMALANFTGIYIDRWAYADRAEELEANLTKLVNVSPIISDDQTLSFYNITDYVERLRNASTAEDWEAQKELAWPTVCVSYPKGFYGLESSPPDEWRWCDSHGQMTIDNASDSQREVTIDFNCLTGQTDPAILTIEGSLFSAEISVTSQLTRFSKTLVIPPGRHQLKFSTNARRLVAANDNRRLYFQIRNLNLTPVSARK